MNAHEANATIAAPASMPRAGAAAGAWSRDVVLHRARMATEAAMGHGLSGLVVYGAPTDLGNATTTAGNVRYLTGWADRRLPSMLVLSEGAGVLIVEDHAQSSWAAQRGLWVEDIRSAGGPLRLGQVAGEVLPRVMPRGRFGLVGRSEIPAPVFSDLMRIENVTFVDADDIVGTMRLFKDESEINLMRAAAQISDAMLNAVISTAGRDGVKASELLCKMECTGRELGAEYSSGWIATGEAPMFPGYNLWQNARILRAGDRVAAGTNVIFDGYWSHGLRMAVRGTASEDLEECWRVLLAAQDAAFTRLEPGFSLAAAVDAMQRVLDSYAGLDPKSFKGRAGHSLGLTYYDPIGSDAFVTGERRLDTEIKPGLVLELHPNFTARGTGFVCVGDVVLVTDKGPEWLTSIPRELFSL